MTHWTCPPTVPLQYLWIITLPSHGPTPSPQELQRMPLVSLWITGSSRRLNQKPWAALSTRIEGWPAIGWGKHGGKQSHTSERKILTENLRPGPNQMSTICYDYNFINSTSVLGHCPINSLHRPCPLCCYCPVLLNCLNWVSILIHTIAPGFQSLWSLF